MSEAHSTRTIQLQGKHAAGRVTMVDEDVYFWARHFAWFVTANGYAFARTNARGITLHRIIMGNPDGALVDHRNCDRLDNRRANLRLANKMQNTVNSRPRKNARSRFKGVTWSKPAGRWTARLFTAGKSLYLGLFDREEDAAKAYDAAAQERFGEFAYLNFPPDTHDRQEANCEAKTIY